MNDALPKSLTAGPFLLVCALGSRPSVLRSLSLSCVAARRSSHSCKNAKRPEHTSCSVWADSQPVDYLAARCALVRGGGCWACFGQCSCEAAPGVLLVIVGRCGT